MTKIKCKKCNKIKDEVEMVKSPNTKSGYLNKCKECHNSAIVERRFSNKSKHITVASKECSKCSKTKSADQFTRDSLSSTGLSSWCKQCNDEVRDSWTEKHKDEISVKRKAYRDNNKEKIAYQKRQSLLRNLETHLLTSARRRASKKGLEFNIEFVDITIPERCPLLDVPLEVGVKGNYNLSPSLDRIDNTKGYIKGNVWVISSKANSMKNSATFDELKTFCKNITLLLKKI